MTDRENRGDVSPGAEEMIRLPLGSFSLVCIVQERDDTL